MAPRKARKGVANVVEAKEDNKVVQGDIDASISNNGLQTRSSQRGKEKPVSADLDAVIPSSRPSTRSSLRHTEKLAAVHAHSVTPPMGPSTQVVDSSQILKPRPRKKLRKELNGEANKQEDEVAEVQGNLEGHADQSNEEEQGKERGINHTLPYTEVELPDGRIMRKCCASDKCATSGQLMEKRLRMVAHLRDKHGLLIDIPKRTSGRPQGSKSQAARPTPNPHAKSWRRVALKRSMDAEWKWRENCRRNQAKQYSKAERAWEELRTEFKTMSKEEYIGAMAKSNIGKFMSTAASRKAKIQERIRAKEKRAMKVDTSNQKVERVHKVRFEDNEQVLETPRKKLPIRSCNKKRTKDDEVLIEVHSPSESDVSKMKYLTFEMSNGHINMRQEGNPRLILARGNVARSRLCSRANISFMSKRSGLICSVDEMLLKAIMTHEASTETMNMFSIWMENTMPHDILHGVVFVDSLWYSMAPSTQDALLQRCFSCLDVSGLVLCFFPVICRSHWTLFTLYVNESKKVPMLGGRKSYLLYFDSMAITEPNEFLKSVYRALEILAPLMADATTNTALLNPARGLKLMKIDAPKQRNGVDCGFYVMACMKYLIAGIMQDDIGEAWLTKDWFHPKDVEALKIDLSEWAMQCLSIE